MWTDGHIQRHPAVLWTGQMAIVAGTIESLGNSATIFSFWQFPHIVAVEPFSLPRIHFLFCFYHSFFFIFFVPEVCSVAFFCIRGGVFSRFSAFGFSRFVMLFCMLLILNSFGMFAPILQAVFWLLGVTFPIQSKYNSHTKQIQLQYISETY